MNFLNTSFRIGRLFGINIRVHLLFILWIAFQLFSAPPGGRLEEALFYGILFGIVFLHELGHCFGARAVGGEARDILMWPLGGLAYAQAPMRPWPQFVTIAAGPLVNVIFCVVSAGALLAAAGDAISFPLNPLGAAVRLDPLKLMVIDIPPWFVYAAIFFKVNFFLLVFNLLPIYPLDGGQLFQAIIWPFVGLRRATIVACYLGLAGAAVLALWGMQRGGGILFFIAIFGGLTCYQRLQMARYGMLVEEDRFGTYDRRGRYSRRRGLWSRLFTRGRGARPTAPVEHPPATPSANPNPGAWEARLVERERLEAELDRILKKVSEGGIHSLSYVERQTLERATRQRLQEERQFERDTHL